MAARIYGDYLIQASTVFVEKPAHWKPVITITRRPDGEARLEPQTFRDLPMMFMNEGEAHDFGLRFGMRMVDEQMKHGMSLSD